MKNVLLGMTKDGRKVFDRTKSHIHSEDGLTMNLLKEGINKIDSNELRKNDGRYVINMNRIIGYSSCVPTTDEDNVVSYHICRFWIDLIYYPMYKCKRDKKY